MIMQTFSSKAFFAILFGTSCLFGCGDQATNSGIVTTTGMVTDIVRVVGGDRAPKVTGLLGRADPHGYNPTRGDVKKLLSAEVVFYSGLLLEGRMTAAFENVAAQGKRIYAVTDAIDRLQLLNPETGHPDPHVWMDVSAWSKCVGLVAEKLGKFDSANADYYKENERKYRLELAKLDDYVMRIIESIPEEQRVLVTAHDAFSYFARRYKIKVTSPQGVDTQVEPSVADVQVVVDEIINKKIKAIFPESSVNNKFIKKIIEVCSNEGWELMVADELFSDAMGQEGTYEGTYIGMIDHNATTIARALGGEAPERGMQGKLGLGKKKAAK